MTHKVHPYSNRLTILRGWKSRWFDIHNYKHRAKQDYLIREYFFKKAHNTGIAEVEIERFANSVSIMISTSRPGILIGRGGTGIEDIKKDLTKILVKKFYKQLKPSTAKIIFPEIKIDVREIREIEANARLVALNIAEQLEHRLPFRRVIKRALDRVMANKEVQGAKILVKGRLNGTEMARAEFAKEGRLPLQTLRADIDYAHVNAVTKYGVIGVKVWIYKGEKLK